MPPGKLRGGLRSQVQSTVRETYGGSAVSSNFKSRVVHPRNPKLVKGHIEDDKQAPSAYMAEMQLTTDERLKLTYEMRVPQIIELLDMSEQTLQKFTTMDIEEPLFQPFPSDIIFQNFEPFETYAVPLQLRNNDKIARLVKVTQTDSPYFHIISPHDMGNKVAPGMDTTFIIQFTPHEKKDYTHELICITEREKFLVPVKAVGARAILDFPDEVNFGTCPVKYATTKTLFVRNIGKSEGKFQLSVEEPFFVTPDSGKLAVGESMQIDANFKALQTGDHASHMILHYETGEDIYISLYGAAIDYNIRLDKNTLKMENTYISCASQRTVTICNRSEIIVHYKWTNFATLQEELQQKNRFYMDLESEESAEKDEFFEECLNDPTMRDQMSILTRTFQNKNQIIKDDKMLFSDSIISVDPVEGEIWPNSQAEIDVIFKPQEAQSYARTLYCDVTGRESRLPLRVRGDGAGPSVYFSLDTLDVGNVFINSKHAYEVILCNKGDIDAVYSLLPADSQFGPQFSFFPAQGIVVPGGYQAIQVHFCSPFLGDFREVFQFAIEGSPERLKLIVLGSVIGPTFHFNIPKLKFGVVSYGFVNTRYCTLVNTSLIPMTFTLRVPADGWANEETHSPGNSLIDSNISDVGSTVMTAPREFEITPFTGTIAPQSEIDIKVDFVSATVKKYEIALVVDVDGVGEEILSLPILAKCVVPAITLSTPILDYGRCFVHHPYELSVQLVNESDLPARYELLSQVVEDVTPILYSSPEPKAIIQPHSVKEVPLHVTAESLEEVSTVAYFMIFGSSDAPLPVQIQCVGEGPVIHVTPTQIDYGTIPVLSDIAKLVRLSNESLIPAQFSCSMVRPNSLFSVEPVQGIIPPEDVIQLKVIANVDDTVKFQDKLSINISDSQIQTVSLMTYGSGATIVSDPPLTPAVKLGPQFSCQPVKRCFRLTNSGRRPQQMYWTTEGFLLHRAKKKPEYNPDDMRFQGVPPPADPPKPVFRLIPDRMVLQPGEYQDVQLEGYSDKPQMVKERMFCHAIIGTSTGKERIMKVDVSAEFISPLLMFSQREVNFCVMKYPESMLEVETKQVIMQNVSSLPLSVILTATYPFQLLVEDPRWAPVNVKSSHSEVSLGVDESVPVLIQFDPSYKDDFVSRTAESLLEVSFKEHPQKDFVKLKGEVFFPNLTFEMEKVDFGCILNDTEVMQAVVVTNHSPMDVNYQWSFIDSAIQFENKDDDEGIGVDAEYESQAEVENVEETTVVVPELGPPESPRDNASGSSQESRPPSVDKRDPSPAGQQLIPWGQKDLAEISIGIEEVFDILPLYSTLHPHESQKIQFTFYGHANISSQAIARCSVHGGPEYDIQLLGQASLVQHFFDRKFVDYGKQLFDQAAVAEIVLHNTGKVGLDFVVLNVDSGIKPLPGAPNVSPVQGHIKALSQQTLTIKYLPGVPEKFENTFQVRVAHFEPDTITLTGEGVFPRLIFDLPPDREDPRFEEMTQQAVDILGREKTMLSEKSVDDVPYRALADVRTGSCVLMKFRNNSVGDLGVQMEIERLLVKQFALEQQALARTAAPVQTSSSYRTIAKKHKPKAQLISYVLDFGYVVFGTIRSHVVRVTNNGHFPVSFAAEKSALSGSGFGIELDRVRNLPGEPDHESVEFMVTFDPRAAGLPMGPVDVHVPFSLLSGPAFGLRIKAVVTMPDMTISTGSLDFGTVECGNSKVMTIQLHNQQQVRCDWSSEPPEEKKKKSDKMIPLHLRKKLRTEKPKPKHFEVMPPIGSLMPGQRINVQVKFMPTEEISYSQRLVLRIAQSSSRHLINVSGQGNEPKLEFSATLIEFGPVLPHSVGDEKEVVVKNPSAFPVEIYSLEFDKQYLEEEKILRTMKGYDEYNTILLPPRQPGDKLPQEVTEAYNEQQRKKEAEEKEKAEAASGGAADKLTEEGAESTTGPPVIAKVPPTASGAREGGKAGSDVGEGGKDESSSLGVGDLEITPVSAAIARYLGIDLTAEGRAARNRRGIAIIVHGAPLSGKTATAVALAKMYGAALLTVDGVVIEAISNGNTSAAQRAKELCASAARAAKEAEQAAENQQTQSSGGLSVEAVAALGNITGPSASTAGSVTGAQSFLGREGRKTSTIAGPRGGGAGRNIPQVQSPPRTPPQAAPLGRKLSVSASVAGEDGLYSCLLPEDLLVELLAERLQLSDCQRGIVLDGLESLFSPNMTGTANSILRAFNNRKYIFMVTLLLDQAKLKAVEEQKKEEQAKLAKQKEDEEKRRLEEMSEDEYDALTEREKAEVDRKHLEQKKERLKRELERQEKERKEKEMQALLEERRLEEERNQKGKRRGTQQAGGPGARKGHETKDKKPEKSSDKLTPGRATGASQAQPFDTRTGAPSVISERSDSSDVIDEKKRLSIAKAVKHPRHSSALIHPPALHQPDESKPPSEEEEREKELAKRFTTFETSLREIDNLLQAWDRTTGAVVRSETPKSENFDETLPAPGSIRRARDKKDKEKETREREREKEKEKAKEISDSPMSAVSGEHDDDDDGSKKDGIGVPQLIVDSGVPTESQANLILAKGVLPTAAEVMDGLGLGAHGPPIPPPATFAVVPYPVRRRPPLGVEAPSHYMFVASGPDDPNAPQEDKSKETEAEVEKTPEKPQEHSRKGGTRRDKDKDKDDREGGTKSRRDRGSSGRRAKQVHGAPSPPPSITPAEDDKSEAGLMPTTPQLFHHRWVIPANAAVTLRIRFRSEELGQFDQTLNFEIMGTRRRYQLFCRGVCAFPAISREPRVVFPHRKKYRKPEEIVHRKYVLNNETFEFGPLLCGKTRDRYKEGKYPENMEKIVVCNTSPFDADVTFCFQQDSTAATFILDPPNMSLKSGESQELTLWAYPKTPGFFEDAVVCCIRENPEPVVFKVSCHGVRPELELDRKQLQFDRVLLHRKDTKTIFLRNSTLLPVAWRVNGMDNLGDDFSLTTERGVIDAKSEFALQMHFRAVRPTNVKKIVRLEVSDVEQIMGLVQAENIQVHAESYDVALDMSFPKGADGGLDFGVLKVLDETKQTCSLKNKGKFEINFNFSFEATDATSPDVGNLFTVIPNRGPLLPTDRPTQVQVIFRSKGEITIKDQPILRCQIIEPLLAEGGEVIASIPIKISARSVYSKYAISPVGDINFGAMLVNTKKTRVFTIENKGEFDFRYAVLKMINTVSQGRQRLGPPSKRADTRDGSSSGRSHDKPPKPKRADSVRGAEVTTGAPNIRLQLGMFTVYPAVGSVPAGGVVQVTVDMIAENPCFSEEDIAIDISDRPPPDQPQGIPYKLIGEACVPGITTIASDTIGSIFEEHTIVKKLNLFQYLTHDLASGSGVYGEDENKFIFYNTIVGRKARARFRIGNPNKVPCDLVLSVKPLSMKPSARWHDVYEIEPQRASIPAHSFVYATVTFSPPSMQTYNASFEAAVDGMPSAMSKYRNLNFDIQGEGNLPRITVVRPTTRNKKGAPVLLFRRLLLGRTQVLQLSLKNEGTLMSRVNIDLKDPQVVYTISCVEGTKTLMPLDEGDEDADPKSRVHTLSVVVPMGKTADFAVEFNPSLVGRVVGEIRLTVVDNPYEESTIQLIGEGYQDEITIDNIRSFVQTSAEAAEQEIDDNTPASRENHIRFGDCPVGVSKQLSFTLTNHSSSDPVRFTWSPPPEIAFSPCTGHLQPNCAKDVTVNFWSAAPKTYNAQNIPCKVTKIKLGEAHDKAVDWDDRMRTVKWVDVASEEESSNGVRKMPRPAKKKVIEVEPEPPFTPLDDTTKEFELLFTAVCDFAKFRCKTEGIHFKDTLMFQSRVFSFTVSNKGVVQLDYQWSFAAAEKNKAEQPVSVPPSITGRSIGHSTGDSQGRPRMQGAAMPPRPSSSMGGRPSSALALAYEAGSVVSDGGSDVFPFVIEPESGSIPAGKKASFTVKFSPLDVLEYEALLQFSAANLAPNTTQLFIPIRGHSLLPYCHFELEESDYVSGGRRNPELKGPGGAPPGSTLDPSTKVIEFKSCGIKVKNVKRFSVINPTNAEYSFVWTNEDTLDGTPPENANFRCVTPQGMITSGKKYEMVFEYVSDSLDLVESFWRFFVPEYNISVPFVMVGHTFEPALSFERSHINFREMLLGHPTKEIVHLVNEENIPFTFSFSESSCHTEGYASSLTVEPMTGTVMPKSRLPIEVSFTATEQKEVNFNVLCHVKKKTTPLTLNVKAEGYAMNAQLICEDSQRNKVELTAKGTNRINLGMVEINEKATRQLFIINSGKFNFDFSWEIHNRTKIKGLRLPAGEKLVSVTPESGTTPCNTRKRCQLAFCPPCRLTLTGCDLLLKITNGPTFTVNITGTGVQPGLSFSFLRYDFGPSFLYRAGMPVRKTTLTIKNEDTKDISIESQYESTSHLEVQCQPGVLAPNQSMEADIVFYPREARKYHEIIPFEINGLSTMNVEIFGEGTDLRVEVANPSDKKVNFGALRVGQTCQRNLKLVNRSPAPITFAIAITPAVVALQQAKILSINPSSEITLRANGGSCGVELSFKPESRIPHFTEEVMLECAGLSQPIFVVTGSCQGIEITLDSDSIPFGAVVLGSRSTRKLIMHNTGDIGAGFAWNVEKFAPDFSISPVKGYISPGMEVSFEIIFHPTVVNHDLRYEGLRCAIEGGKALKLVLTGSCIPQTPLKEVLHFATHVRTRDTRNLVIHNRTNQLWMLRPVIDGEFWSGPDTITVEPQQSKNYELTYRPLTMTQEGKKHTGSVFFALPDGNGLLYNVTGAAEGPKPINNIQREVPCKTPYTEMLTVTNWLRRPQRFRAVIEMLKPEKPDSATTLKGLDYIDVPGLSRREYRLNFFAHKEGTFSAKVIFRNEQSGEFLFYYVTFKAVPPGVMATIDLATPVRKSTSHVVTLHNPLSAPVTFNSQCSVADIQLPPNFTVPPLSEGSCMFEYLPLKAGELTGRLSFASSELGVYQYDLNLNATPAGTEAPVHFRAGLGTNQSQTCRFVNFAKSKVEYSCKVDNTDFHVEKNITAASASSGGTEVSVEVTYEPSRLGDTRATLTVSSPVGGEYVFPLFGHCSPPKPQGPYTIKALSTTSIPFKNVFPNTTQFTFCVDSPCFNVKASETVRAKKVHNVIVGFEGNQGGSKAPRMGRLMITCPRSAGGAGNVTWTFYLKGVTP